MAFIQSNNLSDSIVNYISDKIIRHEIKPGEKINETGITKTLGVSHSPVREALRVLERNRLVELVPRKGAYVTEIVEEEVESLFIIMTELLVLLAKSILKNATDDEIQKVVELSENVVAAAQKDLDTYHQNVIIFGVNCLEVSHDRVLRQVCLDQLPSVRRIFYLAFKHYDEPFYENARILLKGSLALQKRKSADVERMLRRWVKAGMDNAMNGLKAGNHL